MKRRSFLAAGSAAALAPLIPSIAFAASQTSAGAMRRVRPGEAGWPTAAQWQALNEKVGNTLTRVDPLFGACRDGADAPACREATAQLQNPFYIGDQPGGTQVSGWLDAWTPAPSAYAVRARNAADVAAAVDFAREHNLRVVVKGGGHSYLGTSNAADSLLVWTRGMNDIVLHDAVVPQGCTTPPVPAVTAGAGCMWIDLYTAVTTKALRYVQGGGCTSVGVAGLIQSGGFGSMSKGFGTASANLLEAEVVTADGRVRVVNACQDPDLFWALKGGGGGTFGVVTKLTLRTHDLPEYFGGAQGKIRAKSDDAYRRLIARFFDFYADALFNPHWGEQVVFAGDNTLRISMVEQGLDTAAAQAVWKPFFDWMAASQDLEVVTPMRTGAGPARYWWDAEARKARGNTSLISDPRAGAPAHHAWWDGDQEQVGAFLYAYESQWMPSSLLAKVNRPRLADAIFAASRHAGFELHFNKGLAGAPASAIEAARDTAMNPAVCDAFALAIVADGTATQYPELKRPAFDGAAARTTKNAVSSAIGELRKAAGNPASYVSESSYFEADWQHAYWGANHARLQRVKAQYDPAGLFFVHNGVGSEDWSPDGFTRLR